MVFNVRTNFSILNKGRTARLACTPRILVGASLKAGVTSLMRRIPGACNWRLIVFAGGYTVNDREGLPQIPTFLLMMTKMVATGPSQDSS